MSRLVPWVNESEWEAVHAWLYCDNPADRQRGVDRVGAWRSRGKVPMAVDATATLVEVQLSDTMDAPTRHAAGSADMVLRLKYSMAITRFVNGMVDSVQKGAYARSVAAVAAELGLPDWLVDLRHDATHTVLPTLLMCRLATRETLQWLRQHYWQKQATHAAKLQADILACLEACVGGAKDKAALKDLVQCVGSDAVAVDVLVPLLLARAMLVPADKKLRADGVGSIVETASELYSTWEPILSACHGAWPSFNTALLAACVDALATEPATKSATSRLRTLVGWALWLLENKDTATAAATSVRTRCLAAPNPYTNAVLGATMRGLSGAEADALADLRALHYTARASVTTGGEQPPVDDHVIEAWLAGRGPVSGDIPVRGGWRVCGADEDEQCKLSLDLPAWLETTDAAGKGLVVGAGASLKRSLDISSPPVVEQQPEGQPHKAARTDEGTAWADVRARVRKAMVAF